MSVKINDLKNNQAMDLDNNVRLALRELQTALKSLYDQNTPRLIVYGSYGRQQATETSDIDIMLLYPSAIQPGREIDRLSGVLADLNLRYQVLISVFPATEKDFHHASGAFWKNVREEGFLVGAI